MKGRLLVNKKQLQISNPFSVLNCCLYHDRSFINIVTTLINKPPSLNLVPPSYNLTLPISRVLIGQNLIFLPTDLTNML